MLLWHVNNIKHSLCSITKGTVCYRVRHIDEQKSKYVCEVPLSIMYKECLFKESIALSDIVSVWQVSGHWVHVWIGRLIYVPGRGDIQSRKLAWVYVNRSKVVVDLNDDCGCLNMNLNYIYFKIMRISRFISGE